VLLATRAFDALVDPAIGRQADRLLRGGTPSGSAAALASLLMALGFGRCGIRRAVARPPCWAGLQPAGLHAGLQLRHHPPPGLGHALGRQPAWRARVTAWREGATLAACCWPACCRPGWDWMRPQAFSPWAWHWA
jgi:hypothetical protein